MGQQNKISAPYKLSILTLFSPSLNVSYLYTEKDHQDYVGMLAESTVISPVSCEEPSRMLFTIPITGLASLRSHDLVLRVKTSYHFTLVTDTSHLPLEGLGQMTKLLHRKLGKYVGNSRLNWCKAPSTLRMHFPVQMAKGRILNMTSAYCSCFYLSFNLPTAASEEQSFGYCFIKNS